MKDEVFRVGDGEAAAVAADHRTAEIRSRGYLPLRIRRDDVPHLRAAFPGSAVVLGDETYEVVSETETTEGVVYGLRAWPEGEVARSRVVYGPRLVHAARAERDRAAAQARARPYRLMLYPLVGLLPEEEQERWADRLGLYAVKATLVSGAAEVVVLLAVIWAIARAADEGLRLVLVLGSPVFLFLALTGFGRAFSAAAFRETRGEYLVEAVYAGWKTLRREARAHDPTLVPMTREAFWARLQEPDRVTREKNGSLLFRGLLPHLSWHTGHHVRAHEDFWLVERLPPALVRGRLVFGYRLATPPGRPPHSTAAEPAADAYAQEVKAGIRREWDDFLGSFAGLTSLLSPTVQERAFGPRGGPRAARRAVVVTSIAELVFAAYVLAQPVQSADLIAPWLRLLSWILIADVALRAVRLLQGRYAPSVLRALLPSRALRPERVAYHAHREAERAARLPFRT